jgi:uncharacterized protein (DUF2249 family)
MDPIESDPEPQIIENDTKQRKKQRDKLYQEKHKERLKELRHLRYLRNRGHVIQQMKKWYTANKEIQAVKSLEYRHAHKKDVAASKKKYSKDNKSEIAIRHKRWREQNPEHVSAQKKAWYLKNKEHVFRRAREYCKLKRKNDPQYRIGMTLRKRLWSALKAQSADKAASAVRDLGCTPQELRAHLEDQFLPGMTWENYGNGPNKWNIDHIRPFASFDLTDPGQQRQVCHYTNLQPLWSEDNLRKSDKWEGV